MLPQTIRKCRIREEKRRWTGSDRKEVEEKWREHEKDTQKREETSKKRTRHIDTLREVLQRGEAKH